MNMYAAKRVWRDKGNRNDSKVNAMCAKTSVKASVPSFHDKSYPSLGLCDPQTILEETRVLHIRDGNNQRHVLLQHYVCTLCTLRARGDRSGFHNSYRVFLLYTPKMHQNQC